MKKFGTLTALTFLLIVAGAAAQDNSSPVSWSAAVPGAKHPLKPGDKFRLNITAKIAEGWHVYSLTQTPGGPVSMAISLPPSQPFKLAGSVGASKPETAFDPNFNLQTEFYEESAELALPVAVAQNAAAGKQNVLVEVHFQTCNDRLCLPPTTVTLKVPVEIRGGRPVPAATGKPEPRS